MTNSPTSQNKQALKSAKKTATRIRKLAEIVKENGIYIAVEFDYRVDYGVRTECDCLNVSESQFWFSARLKHTSVEYLPRSLRLMSFPHEHLPPALGPNHKPPRYRAAQTEWVRITEDCPSFMLDRRQKEARF